MLQVIQLHGRHLLLPERYPRFTLLGQALGSARLGYEALTRAVPEVTQLPKHIPDTCQTPAGCLASRHCTLMKPQAQGVGGSCSTAITAVAFCCRSLWTPLAGPSHTPLPGWQAAQWWPTPTTPQSAPTCCSASSCAQPHTTISWLWRAAASSPSPRCCTITASLLCTVLLEALLM